MLNTCSIENISYVWLDDSITFQNNAKDKDLCDEIIQNDCHNGCHKSLYRMRVKML